MNPRKCFIDTDAYSVYTAGDPRLRRIFDGRTEFIIPLVVIGELRGGFAAGKYQTHNERLLQRFLDQPNVTSCSLSEGTTKLYGQIYAKLRAAGKPIGTNDMWIAALCLERNLPLLTLDKHFSAIPNLELIEIQK